MLITLFKTLLTLSCFSEVLLLKGDNLDGYTEQKTIVVVGGGIAGLAAARTLHNTGLYNVIVLEARRERYGGRIFTDRKAMKFAKGIEVDLGPNYLNSMVKDNPLAKISLDEELEVKPVGKVQLHYPEKDQVFTGDDANKVFSEFYQVTLDALDKVKKSGKDIELQSAIKTALEKATTKNDKALLSSILESHFKMALTGHSTQQFFPSMEFGWDTAIVDGWDQIVDILVGGRVKESVLTVELRKPVRQISVDKKKNKVLVRSKDLKQYEADAVIVALPLGVMKTDIVLFDPPLPKQFKKALDSLGVGYSNKVIFQFNKVFWPEDFGIFTMATSNKDNLPVGMFLTWLNLHRFVNKPLLLGMLHDEAAIRMENMTDDEIKENAISVLTKFFGKEKLKDVTVTIVTKSKWNSDNNLLGTITYPKVGIDLEVFKSLSEPLCPFIYFAGEYTTLEHMNTAHGSYMTGVDAANRIINNYCETKEQYKKENDSKKEKVNKETIGKAESKDEL